ncbi:hypothetical protein M9Y10_038094 [Tritrichomonas musculus]|uniref:Uncharacterized protein n=1 Tax=Tritrichomonas musculus TaxID=1915356 RepID=A0ABR2K8B3_9EUKA
MEFFSFNSCTPCSGIIGDTYTDSIKRDQVLIQELKKRINILSEQISKQQGEEQIKENKCEEIQKTNLEITNRLNVLKRINHHMNKQLQKIQKSNVQHVDNFSQTEVDEYLQLKTENDELSVQLHQLMDLAHRNVDTQQKLTEKYQKKKRKLEDLINQNDDTNSKIKVSKNKREELSMKLASISAKYSKYTTENKLILIRLTETEGNLNEKEMMNERLRKKLQDLSGKQQKIHHENVLSMSSRLFDIETKRATAEIKIKELNRMKDELASTQEKIREKKIQIQQLSELLKQKKMYES